MELDTDKVDEKKLFEKFYGIMESPFKRIIDLANNLDRLINDSERKNTFLDILQKSSISLLDIVDRYIERFQELRQDSGMRNTIESNRNLLYFNYLKAILIEIRGQINNLVGIAEILKTNEPPLKIAKTHILNIQISTERLRVSVNKLHGHNF